MRHGIAMAVLVLLAACSGESRTPDDTPLGPPEDLETAAIERGVIRDPKDTDIVGLFARDTDRLCIVPDTIGYRIGAFVDYGEKLTCSGTGKVTRVGETLHVELGERGACSFDARFAGDRIEFPGALPAGCAALCEGNASLAALAVERLSESESEAASLRDAKGRALCPGG